jgi:hypothetical protein
MGRAGQRDRGAHADCGRNAAAGRSMPGRRTRPWIAELPESHEEQVRAFARRRRQWVPGYALVGRDDLLGGFKSEAQQGVDEWKLRISKRLQAYVRRPRMANETHG